MLVHAACSGALFSHNSFVYCDLCEREVKAYEIQVVDETPISFSG
ncbi:MAG: hypothetical protein OK404_02055 [Thaumarchaeota archaeon]|nr:hypothetical protein [Nitrososphaerota archaeon]